jgi:hypothetical protein
MVCKLDKNDFAQPRLNLMFLPLGTASGAKGNGDSGEHRQAARAAAAGAYGQRGG